MQMHPFTLPSLHPWLCVCIFKIVLEFNICDSYNYRKNQISEFHRENDRFGVKFFFVEN